MKNKFQFFLFACILAAIPFGLTAQAVSARIQSGGKTKINPNIYGHFAEHLGRRIYDGFYVGEDNKTIPNTKGVRNDIIAALRKLKVPVLRWPGGCFADTYHWMDGIGPKDKRPTIVKPIIDTSTKVL